MRADMDLSRWIHRAREKVVGRRPYRCPCGSTRNEKLSYDKHTDVVCCACSTVIWRMTVAQTTHVELVG